MSIADSTFELVYPIEEDFFGVVVSIIRGSSRTDNVTAIVQLTEHETVDMESGLKIMVESRDYLILKANYLVEGVAVEPRRGDLIVETIQSVERSFECAPYTSASMSKAIEPYEEEDADGLRWVIRTKEVLND